MMFFLLSGRCVHEGGTLNEQLGQAMQMAAPPLRSVAPALARGVAAVVDKALQLTKQDRWPDAARMRQAVRSAYDEEVCGDLNSVLERIRAALRLPFA